MRSVSGELLVVSGSLGEPGVLAPGELGERLVVGGTEGGRSKFLGALISELGASAAGDGALEGLPLLTNPVNALGSLRGLTPPAPKGPALPTEEPPVVFPPSFPEKRGRASSKAPAPEEQLEWGLVMSDGSSAKGSAKKSSTAENDVQDSAGREVSSA
jgi:hypothetical protein